MQVFDAVARREMTPEEGADALMGRLEDKNGLEMPDDHKTPWLIDVGIALLVLLGSLFCVAAILHWVWRGF